MGVLGAGVLLYGLYKLYRHIRPSVQGLTSLNVSFDANEEDEKETFSFMSQANERNPYEYPPS